MYNKKRKGIIGIIITIVILIFIVIVSNIETNNLSYAQNVFSFFVMPVQNGLTYLKNWIFGNDNFFTDISNLKEENEKLKEENSNLEKSLREYEIIKSENETLKEYVNLKNKYNEYETVPAYVINKDISNYSNVIVINVGTNDGINVNMPVISDKGLVGHIISVTPTNAKVQTIIDTASSVSCILTSSRDTLIAKGTLEGSSNLKATYIGPEATIMQGNTLETSGLGGIYPKGILVGTVNKVITTKNITDRYALIDTAVNFNKLETVLVITK
ncbi:MAG: rod shape-determining protein MreC [Clostridia bacterium]|nr:rod shape-determining protein MreC [Clostridia bacterium]